MARTEDIVTKLLPKKFSHIICVDCRLSFSAGWKKEEGGGEGRGRRRGWEEGEEEKVEGKKGINCGRVRVVLLLTVFSGGNQLQQRCFL